MADPRRPSSFLVLTPETPASSTSAVGDKSDTKTDSSTTLSSTTTTAPPATEPLLPRASAEVIAAAFKKGRSDSTASTDSSGSGVGMKRFLKLTHGSEDWAEIEE